MQSTITDLLVVMTVGLFLGGVVLNHIPSKAVNKRGKWLIWTAVLIGAVVLLIRAQTGE